MLWINLGSSVKKNTGSKYCTSVPSRYIHFSNVTLLASLPAVVKRSPCLCECSVERAKGFYLQFLAALRIVANVIKMASQRRLSQNLLNMPEYVQFVLCMLTNNFVTV